MAKNIEETPSFPTAPTYGVAQGRAMKYGDKGTYFMQKSAQGIAAERAKKRAAQRLKENRRGSADVKFT